MQPLGRVLLENCEVRSEAGEAAAEPPAGWGGKAQAPSGAVHSDYGPRSTPRTPPGPPRCRCTPLGHRALIPVAGLQAAVGEQLRGVVKHNRLQGIHHRTDKAKADACSGQDLMWQLPHSPHNLSYTPFFFKDLY